MHTMNMYLGLLYCAGILIVRNKIRWIYLQCVDEIVKICFGSHDGYSIHCGTLNVNYHSNRTFTSFSVV